MGKAADNDTRKLADLTFELLASCHEKEERLAASSGLTPAEFRYLRLFDLEEKSNNKAIAAKMNLSQSRLSRILDGLVKKGYVIRKIDPEDRRNMQISLTKKGNSIVGKLNVNYMNMHKEILENIESSQHKNLINAMTQLLSALQRWMKEADNE